MLFLNIEKYGASFHVYGETPRGEGNVVTLKQVIQNRRDQIAHLQKQVEGQIERLTTQSFRLSEELHGSEFLNECVWNPR